MPLWSDNLKCPYCGEPLHVETGTTAKEWLEYLKPLGVRKRDFERHYREYKKKSGKEPSINDVVWSVLASLVAKHRRNERKLHLVYLEQAELVASELKDPRVQLDLAGRYPPYVAMLRRNQQPLDYGLAKYFEAYELERESKTDEAIALYKFLIKHRLPDDRPYERLRIIYIKQKKYRDAIRVCEAYLRTHRKNEYTARPLKKFAEWIPKLEAKLDKQKAKRK
jgi:tetratricopeptide (TPR) repeat protein